jgi:hypothetical protein
MDLKNKSNDWTRAKNYIEYFQSSLLLNRFKHITMTGYLYSRFFLNSMPVWRIN